MSIRQGLLISTCLIAGCAAKETPTAKVVVKANDRSVETSEIAPHPESVVKPKPSPKEAVPPKEAEEGPKVAAPKGEPKPASPATPAPPEPATQPFDRIERAHAAWTRGNATIAVSNATPQGTTRARFQVDLDGKGGLALRLQVPIRGNNDQVDQTYRLKGSALSAIDWIARERLQRTEPTEGPAAVRLATVLGGIDESVAFLLTQAGRDRYLKPMRALTGWKKIPSGLVRQTTAAGKTSLTRLDLDPSGRLKGLHVAFPGSKLDWTFTYGPPRPFVVPGGLKRVESFTTRLRPPHYADAKAKAVVESMLRAGGGLRSAIVRLDDAATLWIGGSRVRYESGGTGFAYDGKRLTIVTPGAAYQGPSRRYLVIDYVAEALGTVDPLVRSVLVRTPPYAELFPPQANVRVVGAGTMAGQPYDMVKIEAPRFRASLFVRKSDHLPLSIDTDALVNGRTVGHSSRTMVWSSVGNPLPPALFGLRLRAGQKVLPLPVPKKKE